MKSHFGNENLPEPDGLHRTTNSNWIPKNIHHTVKTYIQKVKHDLSNSDHQPPNNNPNLSRGELEALKSLRERDDIIISKADKGGAVVIQDIEAYITEANRQLGDTEFYQKEDKDLTPDHTLKVNEAITQLAAEKLIDEKTAKHLRPDNPKTPKFYMLPKVHKQNNPGRPIIAAINSPTTNLSRYVDHHLQPLAEKLPSYIKDTGAFLRKIESTKQVNPNAILVTMDVAALYTSIPHREGINAVAHYLEKRENPSIATRVILKFLTLILFLNNFSFNDVNYLQRKGCAMGAKCSGSYADLFMGLFESRYIYPRINNKHRLYTRFKDDIFLVWTDGEASLLEFFKEINTCHPSIKFECHHSRSIVNYLDTNIHLDRFGNLKTSLFSKPTDRNAYLHHNSYHPPKQIANIPYGQFLRIKKICSSSDDATTAMDSLESKFTNRGYPKKHTEQQKRKTDDVERGTLLEDKQKRLNSRTPFTTTYNRHHPPIQKIVNKHWELLLTQEKIAGAFQERPVVAYKRNRNLREILGQVHLSRGKKILPRKQPTLTGSRACLRSNKNLCCRHLVSTKTFRSEQTGEVLEILHNLNCRSQNTIYLGHCILCPRTQYVGKSEPPAHLRINTHRHDVHDPKGGAFDHHFTLPGHDFNEHARFTLIEQVKNPGNKAENRRLLESREDYWMTRLRTIAPQGMNDRLNSATSHRIQDICA